MGDSLSDTFRKPLKDERDAFAAEYALILSIRATQLISSPSRSPVRLSRT
jgi:Flp pilus assembly pilin Flp